MRFVARRAFTWEGVRLAMGDILEIPERHPHLDGMFLGRYISYADSADVPHGPGMDAPQPTANPRGRPPKVEA